MSPKKSSGPGKQALTKLRRAGSRPRKRLVDLIVDLALERPLEAYLDPQDVVSLVATVLQEERISGFIAERGLASWQRQLNRGAEAEERVGDLVPEALRAALLAFAEPPLPKAEWARGLVDPSLVREFAAPVIQELLLGFVRNLPIPGLGAGGDGEGRVSGLAGRLGRGVSRRAAGLLDAARTVAGGLGLEMEAKLSDAAKDFSRSAGSQARQRFQDRAQSEEGRRLLGQMSEQAMERVMKLEVADVAQDLDAAFRERVVEVLPGLVAHNAGRAFVQETLQVELGAFLEAEASRPLRALLEEYGVQEEVRASLVTRVDELAEAVIGSAEFGGWLEDLVS